jgi:hypothetical protein
VVGRWYIALLKKSPNGAHLVERQLGVFGVDHHDRVAGPLERDLLVGVTGTL